GTLILDANQQPIPTYDQVTIEETARALTGWNFASEEPPTANIDDFLWTDRFFGPMTPWPAFHDDGPKTILGGMVIPGGQGAEADLNAVLDALASHPNVGPFIGKQLIQRLVTSNPSPEYVARISAVWDDNGSGVRGHLGSVVKAILLDEEALAGTDDTPAFGMVREPVLRVTALVRAFDGTGWTGGEPDEITDALGQAPFGSPSVFNFYRPEYATLDLAGQGLVSPEMQITTHSGLPRQSNALTFLILEAIADEADWFGPRFDLAPLRDAAPDPDGLVSLIERRLMGERIPEPARDQLVQHLEGVDLVDPDEPDQPAGEARAVEALTLVLHSPSFTVQK
ncbi:MAG: DUF1800 family protein, partial [Planctomycetota bacterium]